ncbi:MAG TPA: tRNA preQ1(34) S-adenosylmethionine ribosyltransferase-isomerase QueA [Thermomicrobiales bacterium]|nr:tRNA preQ1(34) S-adenosylmethionine ribosyltransferase-isomerase QueA [Thermomicrobiales bacterium]
MTDSAIPLNWFDYKLPPDLIAQQPVEPRDAARLLLVDRSSGALSDRTFRDLPDLLNPGDLIVVNDTRVLPARLFARRLSGGRVELLLLDRNADGVWRAMGRPARRLRAGERLELLDSQDEVTNDGVDVVGRDAEQVLVRFDDEEAIERHGHVPLPPYIHDRLDDPERYQTVYARDPGSAAAPTAGMHFTVDLLERCRSRGVQVAPITLHVGLGTFQPIKTVDARDHEMHAEIFSMSAATVEMIRETRVSGGRVLAVGTTSVRTLETIASSVLAGGPARSLAGETRLFITPGTPFQLVDLMLTNFHLPRTTLLLLVASFAGEALMRQAYQHAIAEQYRFYSFGDAMLIV